MTVKKSRKSTKTALQEVVEKTVDGINNGAVGDGVSAQLEPQANGHAETPVIDNLVTELTDKLSKLEARELRVKKTNQKLHKFQNKVAQSTQAYKSAQAQLKADIGDRDRAALELQRVIDDVKNGQGILPGTEEPIEDDPEIAAAVEAPDSSKSPINELGNKKLKQTVGREAFENAGIAGDPIGLSDKQVDKLYSEWTSVEALEKSMREDAWWWKKVAGSADTAIITRVISSLMAFRKAHPQAETSLEKLAEQNRAAPAAEKTEDPSTLPFATKS